MKKVLLIAYHFPPSPEIGAVRLGGLAKYLPKFGWEPIVLTVNLYPSLESQYEVIHTQYYDVYAYWKRKLGFDASQRFEQQLETTSKKAFSNRIIQRILYFGRDIIAYPDSSKGWYRFAVEAGNKLFHEEDIDAMISSSDPVITHVIASKLKLEFGVPWIADLRDLWTLDEHHINDHTIIRRLADKRLELRTLSKAEAIVTLTRPWMERLKELHKKEYIYEINNGFDPDQIKRSSSVKLTNTFTITFTGSLHGCLMNPSKLFEAVRALIHEGTIEGSHVQIRFYGGGEARLEELTKHYGLQEIAKHYGFVPRQISFERQRESQLLLLLNWDDQPSIGTCPAKVFEYFAAQRPILSTGNAGGVVEELLKDTNAGRYAPTVGEIKNLLRQWYSEYKLKGEVTYNALEARIEKYSQYEMAKRFAEVLESHSSKK